MTLDNSSTIIHTSIPRSNGDRLLSGANILPFEDARWAILHMCSGSYAPIVPLSREFHERANQAELSCEQVLSGKTLVSWYNYMRPFQWYRSEASLRAELMRWTKGEHQPLEVSSWLSPWGQINAIAMLEDSVQPLHAFSVNGESRGGIMIARECAYEALSARTLAYGEFWQLKDYAPIFWCASYVIERILIRYEHPEWCFLDRPLETLREEAEREIQTLYPEYFQQNHLSSSTSL